MTKIVIAGGSCSILPLKTRKEMVAVIAYGWESEAFYAKWYSRNDPDIIREMQGPILNSASEQSRLTPALLELVRNLLQTDPAYIDRLKRHYQLFKEKVDPVPFRPLHNSKSESRTVPMTRKRHRPRSNG